MNPQIFDLSELKDIAELVTRMRLVEKKLYDDPVHRPLVSFTRTYAHVTSKVDEYLQFKADAFEKPAELHNLDIAFAKHYFVPMGQFINTNNTSAVWQKYFEYCVHKSSRPFNRMLAGIYTHINYSLPLSLYEVKVTSEADFAAINPLLISVTASVMGDLALRDHDLFGLAAWIGLPFTIWQFKKIIVRWRNLAWANYQFMLKHPEKIAEYEQILSRDVQAFRDGMDKLVSWRGVLNLPHMLRSLQNAGVNLEKPLPAGII